MVGTWLRYPSWHAKFPMIQATAKCWYPSPSIEALTAKSSFGLLFASLERSAPRVCPSRRKCKRSRSAIDGRRTAPSAPTIMLCTSKCAHTSGQCAAAQRRFAASEHRSRSRGSLGGRRLGTCRTKVGMGLCTRAPGQKLPASSHSSQGPRGRWK